MSERLNLLSADLYSPLNVLYLFNTNHPTIEAVLALFSIDCVLHATHNACRRHKAFLCVAGDLVKNQP